MRSDSHRVGDKAVVHHDHEAYVVELVGPESRSPRIRAIRFCTHEQTSASLCGWCGLMCVRRLQECCRIYAIASPCLADPPRSLWAARTDGSAIYSAGGKRRGWCLSIHWQCPCRQEYGPAEEFPSLAMRSSCFWLSLRSSFASQCLSSRCCIDRESMSYTRRICIWWIAQGQQGAWARTGQAFAWSYRWHGMVWLWHLHHAHLTDPSPRNSSIEVIGPFGSATETWSNSILAGGGLPRFACTTESPALSAYHRPRCRDAG